MRDIKRRRTSVQSTQQITKAMKLVSTVKLQKARTRAEESKPYFDCMYATMTSLLAKAGNINHPYLKADDSKKKAVIVVTSNRGLAGGYNSNVVKMVAQAEVTKKSFVDTFLNEYGYLYDYVDGNMMDWSVRPNMIFPVAFDYSPLSQDQKKKVLDICTRELLTPKGLRSLSPKSGGYNPIYVGPQTQRDYAYHQGTAWPWLGGFYMEASLKLYKRTRLSFVERQMVGYDDEMSYHCLGTISELFDGNPPFSGRGAISFAMNVAEILRALELLEKYQY